jgi:hypothetical protein
MHHSNTHHRRSIPTPALRPNLTLATLAPLYLSTARAAHAQPNPALPDVRKLDGDADLLLEICLADDGGLLRRSRLIRNSVEFDDSPAAELDLIQRSKDRGNIDAPTTQFDELEGIPRLRCVGRNIVHVLEVKKQKAVVILANRLRGITCTSDQVCSIELELHIFRIRALENKVEIGRHLAKRIEVVVVAERNAEISGAFAELCEELAQPLALIGSC